MNQRDITREQLEDALLAARAEADRYKREAMAFRFIANFEDCEILEAWVSGWYWAGEVFPSLLYAVQQAMKDETKNPPVVEEKSK